jgi:hypothetical protein
MFRQTVDHQWQINLYMLFKKLPKPRGSRSIWYKTSQNMVQNYRQTFRREIREIGAVLHDEIDKHMDFCRSALVLLTYGSRNHKHLEVVNGLNDTQESPPSSERSESKRSGFWSQTA